ncbi:MAG: hypothetical protein R3A46_04730 [Thermomicrobiales bacterium]
MKSFRLEFKARAEEIESDRDQEISNLEQGADGVASNVKEQLDSQISELEEAGKAIIEALEAKMGESGGRGLRSTAR